MSGNGTMGGAAASGRLCLPLKEKLAVANWARDKASMLSPPYADSVEAIAAIHHELGIKVTTWLFRSIVGAAGVGLGSIIRHHCVGAANPSSAASIAKREAQRAARPDGGASSEVATGILRLIETRTDDIDTIHARTARIETVLDSIALSLGIAVPPPIVNARNGGAP